MKTILFAGGGSGGHLMPSLAIAEVLREKDPSVRVVFIASSRQEEADTLKIFNQEYRTIHAGKYPRGLSIRILTFPVLFIVSFVESLRILRELSPALLVSKGGFVSVPVAVAAWLRGTPVVLHSSDSIPNLSDRIIGRLARVICTGFPSSTFPAPLQKKIVQTGNPVRSLITSGSHAAGERITGFSGKRPVLLIIGGSQGSLALNAAVEKQFDALIDLADIIHLTGERKSIDRGHARYFSRTSVLEELPHLYALTDLVVTRAGASVLSELAALRKAAIIVPLPGVAHDHQIRNAEFVASRQAAEHLPQERLHELATTIRSLLADAGRRAAMGSALHDLLPQFAAENVTKVILDVLASRR